MPNIKSKCEICKCEMVYQFEKDRGICDGCYSEICHSDKETNKQNENDALTGKTFKPQKS